MKHNKHSTLSVIITSILIALGLIAFFNSCTTSKHFDYNMNVYMDTVWMFDGSKHKHNKLIGRCHFDSIAQFIMKDNE